MGFDFVIFFFRCKLKVVVNDGCGAAMFVFLDHLLSGIQSLNFDLLVSWWSLFGGIFRLCFISNRLSHFRFHYLTRFLYNYF